jgi:NAD(P)H dehydrogenase (quinone)
MTEVAIVFHSGSGCTELAAAAVARGVEVQPGSSATVFAVDSVDFSAGRWSNDETLRELDDCDAIIFGSPTYMGGPSAQLKAFFDSTLDRYTSQAWNDKIAGGFTVSSTPSGDKLHTLMSMATFAMQMGMIWVGLDQLPINDEGLNRLSYYFGAGAQADYSVDQPAIDARDERTATLLGTRVARIANQLSG